MQTRCHLSVLIHEQAKKYGNREAITFRNFGSLKWNTVSWNQFSLRVKQVSNALLNLGAKPQENIAVFSQNCVQYLYTNFGVYGVRGVTIPFYATTSEQQIQYMVTMLRFAIFLLVNKTSMIRHIEYLHFVLRLSESSYLIQA